MVKAFVPYKCSLRDFSDHKNYFIRATFAYYYGGESMKAYITVHDFLVLEVVCIHVYFQRFETKINGLIFFGKSRLTTL